VKHWFLHSAIPWLRWRMFRTGVAPDVDVRVQDRTFTWANLITLLRLVGLSLFVYVALAEHAWFLAFVIFGIVAFLDSIDGYVARRFDQVTKLGSRMDHVTDRVTIVAAVLTLLAVEVIPPVVVILVIARDALLLVTVTVLGQFDRPLPTGRVPITRTGKLATMILLVALPFLALGRSSIAGHEAIHSIALAVTWIGVCLYYAAFAQYVRAGLVAPVVPRNDPP
jgi:cardiolipin synthase (CMP-forming)